MCAPEPITPYPLHPRKQSRCSRAQPRPRPQYLAPASPPFVLLFSRFVRRAIDTRRSLGGTPCGRFVEGRARARGGNLGLRMLARSAPAEFLRAAVRRAPCVQTSRRPKARSRGPSILYCALMQGSGVVLVPFPGLPELVWRPCVCCLEVPRLLRQLS